MEPEPLRTLLMHGAIVLFLGIVSGIPFWLTIILGRGESAVRSWRVAHATLIAVGLMLLVVAMIGPHVDVSESRRVWLARSLVASGYGFAFALVVGAIVGERGLNPWPLGVNSAFFIGHLLGATGSLVGITILLIGLLG